MKTVLARSLKVGRFPTNKQKGHDCSTLLRAGETGHTSDPENMTGSASRKGRIVKDFPDPLSQAFLHSDQPLLLCLLILLLIVVLSV